MKLISLREYVLDIDKTYSANTNQWYRCLKYANFLSQNLELWMFVPCKFVDSVWVVLEEPDLYNTWEYIPEAKNNPLFESHREYQEAKDRVLFEGFDCIKWDHGGDSYSVRKYSGTKQEIQVVYYKSIPNYYVWSFETIEDLVKYNLELTPTAQKQIGL